MTNFLFINCNIPATHLKWLRIFLLLILLGVIVRLRFHYNSLKKRRELLLFKEFYSTNLFIFAQWLVIIGISMLFIHTLICKKKSAVKYENKTKLVSKLTKQIKKEICCSIRTNYPDSKLNSFSFLINKYTEIN